MKKNRRTCSHCHKTILDVDFRRTNQCKQCGSSFCISCLVDEVISSKRGYVCKKCIEKNREEFKVEKAILDRGW